MQEGEPQLTLDQGPSSLCPALSTTSAPQSEAAGLRGSVAAVRPKTQVVSDPPERPQGHKGSSLLHRAEEDVERAFLVTEGHLRRVSPKGEGLKKRGLA